MIRRTPLFVACLLLAILPLGCSDAETAAAETDAAVADLSPEELGRLGARLHESPGRAEEILAERGLTWEAFESAVRELAEDPEASRRYSEAFRAQGDENGSS